MKTPNQSTNDQKLCSTNQSDDAYAKELHLKLFPEVYDFAYDSIAESHERRLGKNPMRSDYQEAVLVRRKKLNVSPTANAFETLEWVRKKLYDGFRDELDSMVLAQR